MAPITPILDDFNRANGGLGANWINPAYGNSGTNAILSNQLVQSAGASFITCSWSTPFSINQECYITCASLFVGAGEIHLLYRIDDPTITSYNGYQLTVPLPTVGGSQTLTLYKVITGGAISIGTMSNNVQAGYAFAVSANASLHSVFYKDTLGANTWILIGSISDTTFVRSGYIGLSSTTFGNTSPQWDDFGGGTFSPIQASDTPFTMSGRGAA